MIKPMTSPPREKTMMIMPSMLENSALFTSTNLVVMAIEPIISKRMMINVSIISKIVAINKKIDEKKIKEIYNLAEKKKKKTKNVFCYGIQPAVVYVLLFLPHLDCPCS